MTLSRFNPNAREPRNAGLLTRSPPLNTTRIPQDDHGSAHSSPRVIDWNQVINTGGQAAEPGEMLVTPEQGQAPRPLSAFYKQLNERVLDARRTLDEAQHTAYVRTVGGASPKPGYNIKQYYSDLIQARADSQVFYANATEVYRDLLWDDVEIDEFEYTHCRYTPIVTEDARDFGKDGYTLRTMQNGNQIKLLICVTLYNEDQETLEKTLLGLCEGLEVLYRQHARGEGSMYGLNWKEVAVCIVQDGVEKAHEEVLATSTVQGFYSPSVLQDTVMGQPTSVHLFEYTARFRKHAGLDAYPPLQVMLATKVRNKGKLDSHCWFFDAFSQMIQPEICMLFDAGTRPKPFALRDIYAYFRRYVNVGAVTGELTVERPWRSFLTQVQYIEWKVAHLLNKPVESLCGYLTVLPGAFSAYRWDAIEGEPLRRYFHGLYSEATLSAFEANMYLAEDRILCLEIVVRKNCRYRLEYVKEAVAEADPVTKLTDLLKQRRRWLNGTFFALIYTLSNWMRVWTESHHHPLRKVVISLEFVYLTIMTIIGTWFGVGILYTIFYNLAISTFKGSYLTEQLGKLVILGYLFLLMIQVVVNVKNKPQSVAALHNFCCIFFIVYMIVFTATTINWLITDTTFGSMASLGVIMSVAGLLLAALLHGNILSFLGAGLQYWVFQPVYLNMLQIYAFANTDDISWGTKNLESASRDLGRDQNLVHSNLLGAMQSNESKAFWNAMMTRHKQLTNIELVRKYNEKKEQKLKAFATYLLLAWLLTNALFFAVVQMICNIEWEVCEYDGASAYAQQVKNALLGSTMDNNKILQAVGSVLYAATAILTESATKYPFGGLPNFPDAYPVLLSGTAQSATNLGRAVTVLTDSRDVLASIGDSVPRFDQWVNWTAGVNLNSTMQDLKYLNLPDPSQYVNRTEITCHLEFGRQYYMMVQFWILSLIVLSQVGGSVLFIFKYWWHRATWRMMNNRHKGRNAIVSSTSYLDKKDPPGVELNAVALAKQHSIGAAYPSTSSAGTADITMVSSGSGRAMLARTLSKPKERRTPS